MQKPHQFPGRAPKIAAVAARNPENSAETLIRKQSAWISRRLGLTPDLARVCAELAFSSGRSA